jgi:GWxTD domain-containing protein
MRFSGRILLILVGIICIGSARLLHAQQSTFEARSDSLREVIRALRLRLETEPENVPVKLELGYTYLRIEDWGKADKIFKECIALNDTLAEAFNGLGMARHGKGEGAVIPVEAIKKLFKIDNYSKAEKNFKQALELRPDYLDPRYNLGVNYLAKGGSDNYSRAIESFQVVSEKDSLYREVDYMLGVSFQHMKDWDKAEEMFHRSVKRGIAAGKSLVKLSEVYLERGEEEEATRSYYEGLVNLTDPGTLEDILAELEPLMHKMEKEEYRKLAVEKRGDYFRKFWKKKDPTPTTMLNERYIVHFRRVKFAKENFPDIVSPYYDDRGKIYVKYGPPDDKYISDVSKEGTYENESWTYELSIQRGLTFDFVKKGHSYRQVIDLSEATPAGNDPVFRRATAQNLYLNRAFLSEAYQRFQVGEFQNQLTEFHRDRNIALETAPAERYIHQLEGEPLNFVYNLSQFKGASEGDSRTEVYVGISSNDLQFQQAENGVISPIQYAIIIQDTNYVDIYQRKKGVTLQAGGFSETTDRLFLYQEDFPLPPGSYRVALRMENPTSEREGLYQHFFEVRSFGDPKLLMSDIQLASNVEPVSQESGEGMFVKKGLQVIPYPYNLIRKNRPIYIYFEVYNLRFGQAGRTNYTVSYQVEILQQKRGFLSKTLGAIGRFFSGSGKSGVATSYTQQGEQSESSEYLSLDMRKLPEGIAKLAVTVVDNTSGESTTQSVQIQLVE